MRVVAVGAGIMLLAVVLLGTGKTHGPVTAQGAFMLAPVAGSGVSATATMTQGSQAYIFVRATNLAGNVTYGFALMYPHCQGVRQMLNPLTADMAGDASSTSGVDGANDGWWLGILATDDAGAALLACGPTTTPGSTPEAPTGPTTTPPSGGSTVVPVTTPTHPPTPLPGGTPHPPGS